MKRILIVGNYVFGKKYMQHAKRLGYEVILAAAVSEESLSAMEKSCMDYYIQIDYFNEEETVKKIQELYKDIPFEGVLAGHVFLPKIVNLITVHLNLPSFGTKAVEYAMLKEKTREKLKDSGMFEDDFFIFNSKEEIIQQKKKLSYPYIVKPLNGFGSINVERVDSLEELLVAFKKNEANLDYGFLGPIFTKQVLVEPFISGKEFSVESIIENGIVNSIMITEKVFNEKFENVENGHIIPAVNISKEEEKQILKYVKEIHELFDVRNGITHTEVKVNQSGVHLIELNPRVGGGFIAEMLSKVLNVDFYKIILDNCVGKKCDINLEKKGFGYILSPGPKSPTDYQETMKIIDKFKGKVPILGVCLGHQIIAEYFGGKVTYAPYVCHGKAAQVDHDKQGVFTSLTGTLQVGRYHSLIVDRTHFPISELDITSQTTDNLIMGIRHKIYDIEGIQFHPESILTNQGFEIVKNFVLK